MWGGEGGEKRNGKKLYKPFQNFFNVVNELMRNLSIVTLSSVFVDPVYICIVCSSLSIVCYCMVHVVLLL